MGDEDKAPSDTSSGEVSFHPRHLHKSTAASQPEHSAPDSVHTSTQFVMEKLSELQTALVSIENVRDEIYRAMDRGADAIPKVRALMDVYTSKSFHVSQLYLETNDPKNWEQTVSEMKSLKAIVHDHIRSVTYDDRHSEPEYDVKSERQSPPDHLSVTDIAAIIRTTIESTKSNNNVRSNVKAVDIPVYDGKTSLSEFLQTFDGLVPTEESDTVKIIRLKDSCKGQPKDLIERLPNTSNGYVAARKLLQQRYGGEGKDIQIYLRDARLYGRLKNSDAGSIRRFSNFVQSLVAALEGSRSESELGDGSLFAILCEKLQDGKKAQYYRWLADEDREPSVKSLNRWLNREAVVEQRIQDSDSVSIQSKSVPSNAPQRQGFQNKSHTNRPQNFATNSNFPPCPVCQLAHAVSQCAKFKSFGYDEKWECAKALRLCFRCLKPGHSGRDCRKTIRCGIQDCRSTHHQLLHRPDLHQNHQSTPSQQRANDSYHTDSDSAPVPTSLRTLPIYVISNGIRIKLNCCLDDGSTSSFISEQAVHKLGLQCRKQPLLVNTLSSGESFIQSGQVEFTVCNLNESFSKKITAYTCPNPPTGDYKPIDWSSRKHQHAHLAACKFDRPCYPFRVDLIIGISEPDLHVSRIDYSGKPGTPSARLGPLGWTCIGPVTDAQTSNPRIHHAVTQPSNQEVLQAFEKMWSAEPCLTSATDQIFSQSEKRAYGVLQNSLTHDGSRYEVAVPWAKDPASLLHNNFECARKRLESLERTFQKRPELRTEYKKTLDQYIDAGYIKPVPVEKSDGVWYLPHFAVVREDRQTTKVRPVFDGSAKFREVSLNDAILDCPNLQPNLFDVLLRFRKHPVAVTCDIQKMYLRITIPESDRPFFRFLWRENGEIVAYEFQVVAFGSKCAPAQAIYVSQENARKHAAEYPQAAEAVLHDTYMDDVLTSVESESEGVQLQQDLGELWGKAGMTPHKWLSNSAAVMENAGETATPLEISDAKPVTKVLGQKWNPESDEFQPYTTVKPIPVNTPLTLRKALSYIATTFDPVGFVSPIIAQGRMLIQDMYALNLGYDDQLPPDLNYQFAKWLNALEEISHLRFERCLIPENSAQVEMIVFADASERAMSAVSYIRTVTDTDVSIRFLASKTKLCPMKPRTIPELELSACAMAVSLAERCCIALGMQLNTVTFFTDSVDVIWWIRGSKAAEFKPYVKNRINQIQNLTDSTQWHHVKGTSNPADVGSRGCDAGTLCASSLWKDGPIWLKNRDPSTWPGLSSLPPLDHELPERRKSPVHAHHTEVQVTAQSLQSDLLHTYSSLDKVIRILVWIRRFISNCRAKREDRLREPDPTATEYQLAETELIRVCQNQAYQSEIKQLQNERRLPAKSELAKFQPFLDKKGIMRVGGRLKYATHVPFDARHPILLPKDSRFTRLLCERMHQKNNHRSGAVQLLALMNRKYWIPAGLVLARSIIEKCVLCQKLSKLPSRPRMAALVEERTMGEYPFQYTGVDLAGPFLCSAGARRSPHKRWIIVWTCLTTRAVRLDYVSDLSEKAFLRAFRRFIARNNTPESISSDNGSNFVSAAKTLKREMPKLTWKFISPISPWMGGAWEIMVREMKKGLMKTLEHTRVTDEELATALAEVENSLNSRPLTYLSTDPEDLNVLTPESFLIEKQKVVAPDIESQHLGSRWKLLQDVLRQSWDRFLKEFIPQLNKTTKWLDSKRPVQEGDLVLVMQASTPRYHWPYGIITQILKRDGDDARVAMVKMANKQVCMRPVARLIPIDISA